MNRLFLFFLCSINGFSQNNLESLLPTLNENSIIINTFKSTRIVNNHSIEIFDPSQLDLRISHRFGLLNSGFYDLFGLDQARIRVGLEYGVINNLMLGLGRSTYNKTYDGYLKYVFLKQSKGVKSVPVTMAVLSSLGVNTLKKNQSNYPFLGRLSFSNQLLVASKINSQLSLQLMPTLVHWNMVETNNESNSIFVIGTGFRYLISKSVSVNSEYFLKLNNIDDPNDDFYNSFSIGLDIETGGHVFQLHITNSMPMDEASFITRTQHSWSKGEVHFGFNISREFSL